MSRKKSMRISNLLPASEETETRLLFDRLPTEILIKIFKYLNLEDLVSLDIVGLKRITYSLELAKKVDFRECRFISPHKMACFFSTGRLQYIREINFSHYCYVRSTILEKAIVRCRLLEILSVLDCGLNLSSMSRILSKFQTLKSLTWNATGRIDEKEKILVNTNMLRLNLYVEQQTASTLFFQLCHGFQELVIDMLLPLHSYVGFFSSLDASKFQNLEKFILNSHCLSILEYIDDMNPLLEIIRNVFCDRNKCRTLWIDAKLFTNCSAILNDIGENITPDFTRILLNEENLGNILPKLKPNSLDAVGIACDSMSSSLLQSVEHAGGSSLRHLLIHTYLRNSAMDYTFDAFENLLHTCCNITVLDLGEAHFSKDTEDSPCRAIVNLKQLKSLSLSSCTISEFETKKHAIDREEIYRKLVENCASVKHFRLVGCRNCGRGPSDSKLNWLRNWKKLEHLVLLSTTTLRYCSFLKHVVDNCKMLKSLQIINIGTDGTCLFTGNVRYVLKMAKSLMFLRINQRNFYVNDETFWKSVSLATNLEGLCVSTINSGCCPMSMILKNIFPLKLLNLFHYKVYSGTEGVHHSVRRGMKAHGIESYAIFVREMQYEDCQKHCQLVHFDIPPPISHFS